MFDNAEFNFSIFTLPDADKINTTLYREFTDLNTNENAVKRTHLFNGRYENIYIDKQLLPAIIPIIDFANYCAKKILNVESDLDIGYWFNDMPPGSITIPHTHDDDDELLSGAFYVKVPENSGNLVIYRNGIKKIITPLEGQLILFNPDCLHEVTKNNSDSGRLSIGMNFGRHKLPG